MNLLQRLDVADWPALLRKCPVGPKLVLVQSHPVERKAKRTAGQIYGRAGRGAVGLDGYGKDSSTLVVAQGSSFDMMIVPLAANMPPTPWQTEILAPGIWAGAVPRI